MSESEFPFQVSGASAKDLLIAGRKWLLYGLLTCCLISAIASLKFGTKLPYWRTWGDGSSSAPTAIETQNKSLASEIAAVRLDLAQPSSKYSAAFAPGLSSPPSIERGHLGARQENIGLSFSTRAIRVEQLKLPVNVQSTITSDNTVKVRVQIDNSGKVINAMAISTKGQVAASLVDYALEAARHSRFKPTRQNGESVASDKVLEFLYRPSDSFSGASNEWHERQRNGTSGTTQSNQ